MDEQIIKEEKKKDRKLAAIGVIALLAIFAYLGYVGSGALWDSAYEKGRLSVNSSVFNSTEYAQINSTAYAKGQTDAYAQINLARADAYCIAQRDIANVSVFTTINNISVGLYPVQALKTGCFGAR